MHQLFMQLLLGSLVIVAATAIQAVGMGMAAQIRLGFVRRLRKFRLWTISGILGVAAIWFLGGMTVGVWLWAGCLIWVGAFEELEPAVYFALVSYTTLGFGDLLPPEEWRIFGAMIGANGMLGFGMATAALVRFVERIRDHLTH